MCYSKEVQLITSLLIFVAVIIYYFFWKNYLKDHKKKWLLPFLNNLLLGFTCIGGHQFFEFLSLATGNIWIYKTGLLISLSSMFFFLRALENLTETRVHSKIALVAIALTALFVYLTPATFGSTAFYVQHKSAFIWAFSWVVLFVYWHICAFYIIRKYKEPEVAKSSILWFIFASLDISFIASVIYTFYGYINLGTNVCTDYPSIWCTFFVLQVLVVPLFLSHHLRLHKNNKIHELKVKTTEIFVVLSIIIVAVLASLIPFFKCLSWKFAFP